jgi:nitronate monooxygenase
MWPNQDLLQLLGIDLPIIQAPMAGCNGAELAAAVAAAGGLGSLPCAMLMPDKVRSEVALIRRVTSNPINLNFFCHQLPQPDAQQIAQWRARLLPYYEAFGLELPPPDSASIRQPFDAAMCDVVEELKPAVVSFHFGLPTPDLLDRVKGLGCKVLSSATTVREARWLAERGVDAIIAQGLEAGGHRGMFLSDDFAYQVGTFALVPQVVDAVALPVIAAGGIADSRGIAAALALGAAGVQLGSAYLLCPEANTSHVHREALRTARDDQSALTNLFSGRPARALLNRFMKEVGPMSSLAPDFPLATADVAPLRARAESQSSGEFSPLWAGQAAALACEEGAGDLTRRLASQALEVIHSLSNV